MKKILFNSISVLMLIFLLTSCSSNQDETKKQSTDINGELVKELEEKVEKLNTKINNLKKQLAEKDEVINNYEYEKNLYDLYDVVPIQFLQALERKDIDSMNDLTSEDLEIKVVDNEFIVYNKNNIQAYLGSLSYKFTGYTIHGFRYLINEKMLVVYTQVFYEDDDGFVSPPTYIEIGFRINEKSNYPLLITSISRSE